MLFVGVPMLVRNVCLALLGWAGMRLMKGIVVYLEETVRLELMC